MVVTKKSNNQIMYQIKHESSLHYWRLSSRSKITVAELNPFEKFLSASKATTIKMITTSTLRHYFGTSLGGPNITHKKSSSSIETNLKSFSDFSSMNFTERFKMRIEPWLVS